MKTRFLGLLTVGLLAVCNVSMAASIVDTGPITNQDGATGTRARAGQFTLTSQTVITGLERYAAVTELGDGQALFTIYTDSNNLPGTPIAGLVTGISVAVGGTAWLSASGLSWNLGPGTYWLVFEGAFGQPSPPSFLAPFCGELSPGSGTYNSACIASPLALEAGLDSINPDIWSLRSARTGWRIDGYSVPEPGTLALLGLGLAGLGVSRRRKMQ